MPADPAALHAVAAALQAEGYRAEIREEAGFVASGAAGLNFAVNVYGVSVQLRSSVPYGPNSSFDIEDCNRFNSEYRVGKVYIDADGDVMIEADHFVAPLSEHFPESFKAILTLWEGLLGLLKEMIRTAPPKIPEDSPTAH